MMAVTRNGGRPPGASPEQAASKECAGCHATLRDGEAVVFLHGDILHARCVSPGLGLGGVAATDPAPVERPDSTAAPDER